MPALFDLGRVLATPGALEALSRETILDALHRHQSGDWGTLDPEDVAENNRSVRNGSRILSAYQYPDQPRFWIITEADRSATTVLLPEEY